VPSLRNVAAVMRNQKAADVPNVIGAYLNANIGRVYAVAYGQEGALYILQLQRNARELQMATRVPGTRVLWC
jgi:hypothetical protein